MRPQDAGEHSRTSLRRGGATISGEGEDIVRSVRGAVGPFGASESETVTGVCGLGSLGHCGLGMGIWVCGGR